MMLGSEHGAGDGPPPCMKTPPRTCCRGGVITGRWHAPYLNVRGLTRIPFREQPQNDGDRDQTDNAIVAELSDYVDKVGNDIVEKCELRSDKYLKHNCESNQQQAELRDLAKPPFRFFNPIFRHASPFGRF